MKYLHRLLAVAAAAFFIAGAHAQQGTVTSHGFAIGKGVGVAGYTSLLCTSAQLAVGQAAADPICRTITGDVTLTAAGVTAIGATVVHSAMLNADVFSTAHSWGGVQSFTNPVVGTQSPGDNSTKAASTAYADAAVALRVALTRNVLAGCGLTGGGDLSADRTLKLSLTVNSQVGTSYTVVDGDCGKVVRLNNAAAVAVTLPQANGSTFVAGWTADFQNIGIGTVTITPTTSTVNSGSNLVLTTNQGAHCDSDGANYTCVLGVGAGGGSGVTSLTPGAGLVSLTTASCSQSAVTSSGTFSSAECVNAQTGTSYAIVDGDRAKLITATNAAAQAYTIAQAGASSAFQSGWHTEIENDSATGAGIVTITATTSSFINGGVSSSTLAIYPGQTVKLVSDGTNYKVIYQPVVKKIQVVEQQTAGTGTSNTFPTTNSWTVVVLNSVAFDNIGLTLSGNQITNMPPGPWTVDAKVPFADGTAGDCVLRLRDATLGATLWVGQSTTSRSNGGVWCIIEDGTFTTTSAKAVQLELIFDAGSFGSGSMNSGEVNRFARMTLKQERH